MNRSDPVSHQNILLFIAGALLISGLLAGCGETPNSGNTTASGAVLQQVPPLPLTPLPVGDILFGNNSTGNYEIYAIASDGSNLRKLTSDVRYDNWWPRISPDRKKILFYRSLFGEGGDYEVADLMTMNVNGSNLTTIRYPGDDGWTFQAHAEWSPDAQTLAMCGTANGALHLFLTDTEGNIIRRLTNDGRWNCDPSWSPDGNSIVFNRCETQDCEQDPANLEVYTIRASGSAPIRLTNNSVADYDPYFSPDGGHIAWLANTDPQGWDGAGQWAIRIMEDDGGNPQDVINDGQINSKPAWSFDGKHIFFHRFEPLAEPPGNRRWRIFSIQPDGRNLTAIDPFDSGQSEYPSN